MGERGEDQRASIHGIHQFVFSTALILQALFGILCFFFLGLSIINECTDKLSKLLKLKFIKKNCLLGYS